MKRAIKKTLKIGGASGFWGDSDLGLPQLLEKAELDYIVFDYLAEITMSVMARARLKNPDHGYATDFVSSIKRNLKIIAKKNVRLISNAGGVNPEACGAKIRELIDAEGLNLKVAVVTGDDLMSKAAEYADRTEMFSGETYPEIKSIVSLNAYLGAFPIAAALKQGADIVVTGRCVDSAVTLGACIYEFGWQRDDLDCLANASLAGHMLECGPQATGGNFTDWREVETGLADVGHPIVDIRPDGSFDVSIPNGTGGKVTPATVGEQMLYEIGDPQAYILPDVICDFSQVSLQQTAINIVSVSGAKGAAAPDNYKASLTFSDGWKISTLWFFVGEEAVPKSQSFARTVLERTANKLERLGSPPFSETHLETLGNESHYGDFAQDYEAREVALKIAVKHEDQDPCITLLKEGTGLALAAPPGLVLYSGGRPKPSPVVRLFSFLIAKSDVRLTIIDDNGRATHEEPSGTAFDTKAIKRVAAPKLPPSKSKMIDVPLIRLAWARSGDKGNKANIGVLPRSTAFAPWIWNVLTEEVVQKRFAHFTDKSVERHFLPGTQSMNFLLHDALGGGGMASLRNDPQGKCFAQILLQVPISIPAELMEEL